MSFGLIGKKIGMTQRFLENGSVVPVTIVEAGPCPVVRIKTKEKDGYEAIQLGFGEPRRRALSKTRRGPFLKINQEPREFLKEFEIPESASYEPGESLTVEIFSVGEKIDVTGTSRGKGFAGVMKRHHFKGGSRSHGTHRRHRTPGSIGASSYPSRVYKGKRMAGRMGGDRVTTQNVTIIEIDKEKNIVVLKGSVPGPAGGFVIIKKGIKNKENSQ